MDDSENEAEGSAVGARKGIAERPSGKLKWIAAGFGVIAGLFEPVRHFIVNAGIVAGLILGGPAVYKMVTRSSFVIKDISVPASLANRGFSGDVIAQQILDHVAEIDRAAGSKADKSELSGIELNRAMPPINLPVGGLNLAAVISELRQLFGYNDTKVTGEVYVAEHADEAKGVPVQYGLRLRIAGEGPIYRSEQGSADVAPLIEAAAHEIMHRYDPVNLGYYYYRTRDLKRASAMADEVLADPRSPNAPWAYTMRGLVDRDEGHLADAAMNLHEAIARAPNFWLGYVHLAGLYRIDHKLDDAETAARKAIELAPAQQEGHAALALILLDRGKEDEALAEMKKGVESDPKNAGGHLELGRLQARVKRFEEAIMSFKTAAALKPSAEPLLNAAGAAKNLKRDGEHLSYLLQAARSEPKNAEAWLQLGELRFKRGEPNRGNDALKKAVTVSAGSAAILLRAAKVWADAKHFAEANTVFTQHAARHGQDPDFLLGWSELLWSEGKKTEALAKMHEAMESAPNAPQVYVNAGRQYESHGHTAEAADAYRKAVAIDPKLDEILKPHIDKLAVQHLEKPEAAAVAAPALAAPQQATTPPHPVAAAEKPVPAPRPAAPPVPARVPPLQLAPRPPVSVVAPQ